VGQATVRFGDFQGLRELLFRHTQILSEIPGPSSFYFKV
jgi:hypothetical protein